MEQKPSERSSDESPASGLVYGNRGLAEFGLRHVGMGLPIHRRRRLQAAVENAREIMNASQAAGRTSEQT